MKKVHPYQHMRPRRIDIVPSDNLSYTVSRFDEDDDIRYGFGNCGKVEREHIEIVEIDLSWLGVVFHIVTTSEHAPGEITLIKAAKRDIGAVKDVAKQLVMQYLHQHPKEFEKTLEIIHDASREQGHLEVIKHTAAAMNSPINLQGR